MRGEADRARAVLWSLDGETSAAIAARLGVRAEQVRRWRAAARAGLVVALRSRPRPGRTPRKREAALAAARDVFAGPAADRPVWTLARLAREIEARTGETISPGHLSVVLRRGLPLAPAAAHPQGAAARGRRRPHRPAPEAAEAAGDGR